MNVNERVVLAVLGVLVLVFLAKLATRSSERFIPEQEIVNAVNYAFNPTPPTPSPTILGPTTTPWIPGPKEFNKNRKRLPGEKCVIDEACKFGCCINNTCVEKCQCPNEYWNQQFGCPDKRMVQAEIVLPNPFGGGTLAPVYGNTGIANNNPIYNQERKNPPGAQCALDLACQFGCCVEGKCRPKCECPNLFWNRANGC